MVCSKPLCFYYVRVGQLSLAFCPPVLLLPLGVPPMLALAMLHKVFPATMKFAWRTVHLIVVDVCWNVLCCNFRPCSVIRLNKGVRVGDSDWYPQQREPCFFYGERGAAHVNRE